MRADEESLSRVETILLLAGLLLGIHLRVSGITHEALLGDEHHALQRVEAGGYGQILSVFDPYGTHIGFPLLQRLSIDVLGPSVLAYRLPAIVAGILGLLLVFPVGRTLVGARAAWLATLVLAVHPMHVFFSRFARPYGWVLLLALLLVGSLRRALPDTESPWRWRWAVAVVVCAGLLPFFHLSTGGLVAGLGIATLYLSWRARRRALDAFVAVAVFLGAGFLTLAVYAAAWDSLRQFFDRFALLETRHVQSLSGIMTVFGGGFLAGVVLSCAVVVAGLALVRRNATGGGLLLAACAVPPLVLLASHPMGMDYAYARYLMSSLPFAILLACWGLAAGLGRLLPPGGSAYVAGLLLLLVAYAASGPLWGSGLRAIQFANTNLAQRDLPAFDVPFDETPAFYRDLARRSESLTIVECPVPQGAPKLLRNYALQHRKRALIGKLDEPGRVVRGGPYVWARNMDELASSGADYFILHTEISREARQYFAFVGRQWQELRRWGDQNLMDKTLGRSLVPGMEVRGIRDRLLRRFGEPIFQDEYIQVWDLRAAPPPSER